MQALKSLFRRPAQQATKIVPTQQAVGKPTPLTPEELKAVAGGLPRIGGFGQQEALVRFD